MSSEPTSATRAAAEDRLDESEVVEDSILYLLGHGLVMGGLDAAKHVPVTLSPSELPKSCFDLARELAPLFNTLTHKVSRDPEFIQRSLENVVTNDEFTGKLYDIYKRVVLGGKQTQDLELGILRSDYMVHQPRPDVKPVPQQVELNTIASSFGCLSDSISIFHKYLVERYHYKMPLEAMPANSNAVSMAAAIARAVKEYGNDAENVRVMFVVQPGEHNVFDQKILEHTLWANHRIRSIRRSLLDIHQRGMLQDGTSKLIIDKYEVAVAYFRAGYTPNDYPSENEWTGREKLEMSTAVKCPSISYHLVGTKKVQQILAQPGETERYLGDADAAKLRTCFAGLYTLSEGEGQNVQEIVDMAIQNPGGFVLKPQREGGGNNLYGDDLKDALASMSSDERSAFILMSRICPVRVENQILRNGELFKTQVEAELGQFGLLLSKGDDIVLNATGGHILRSKVAGKEDGGVAAGVAVLDSPLLV